MPCCFTKRKDRISFLCLVSWTSASALIQRNYALPMCILSRQYNVSFFFFYSLQSNTQDPVVFYNTWVIDLPKGWCRVYFDLFSDVIQVKHPFAHTKMPNFLDRALINCKILNIWPCVYLQCGNYTAHCVPRKIIVYWFYCIHFLFPISLVLVFVTCRKDHY